METQHLCVPTFLASIDAHFVGSIVARSRSSFLAVFFAFWQQPGLDYQIFPFSTRPTTTTMSTDTGMDTGRGAGREAAAGTGAEPGQERRDDNDSDNNDAFVLFYFCVCMGTLGTAL